MNVEVYLHCFPVSWDIYTAVRNAFDTCLIISRSRRCDMSNTVNTDDIMHEHELPCCMLLLGCCHPHVLVSGTMSCTRCLHWPSLLCIVLRPVAKGGPGGPGTPQASQAINLACDVSSIPDVRVECWQ